HGAPEAAGEPESEPVEEHRLVRVGASDAADAKLSARGQRQHDVDARDSPKLVEEHSGTVAEPSSGLPSLERLPERIREEADEDVAFDSIVAMVPDRPDAKLRLLNPEGCFHVRELDVRPPELFGRPIRDVRPEDVRAFRELSPLRPFRPRSPDEPEPRAPRRVVPQIDLVLP